MKMMTMMMKVMKEKPWKRVMMSKYEHLFSPYYVNRFVKPPGDENTENHQRVDIVTLHCIFVIFTTNWKIIYSSYPIFSLGNHLSMFFIFLIYSSTFCFIKRFLWDEKERRFGYSLAEGF